MKRKEKNALKGEERKRRKKKEKEEANEMKRKN